MLRSLKRILWSLYWDLDVTPWLTIISHDILLYNYILYDFIIFYSSQRSFTIISITNKYSDLVHFNNLLTEIGLNDTQIVRLESDGFITMEELVSHYPTGGASDLQKYLRDLNKIFANPIIALMVYYNPVIIPLMWLFDLFSTIRLLLPYNSWYWAYWCSHFR